VSQITTGDGWQGETRRDDPRQHEARPGKEEVVSHANACQTAVDWQDIDPVHYTRRPLSSRLWLGSREVKASV
jgi:hypothetical protein